MVQLCIDEGVLYEDPFKYSEPVNCATYVVASTVLVHFSVQRTNIYGT